MQIKAKLLGFLWTFNLDFQCHAIIIFVLKIYAYILTSSLIYSVHNFCVENEVNELNYYIDCNIWQILNRTNTCFHCVWSQETIDYNALTRSTSELRSFVLDFKWHHSNRRLMEIVMKQANEWSPVEEKIKFYTSYEESSSTKYESSD